MMPSRVELMMASSEFSTMAASSRNRPSTRLRSDLSRETPMRIILRRFRFFVHPAIHSVSNQNSASQNQTFGQYTRANFKLKTASEFVNRLDCVRSSGAIVWATSGGKTDVFTHSKSGAKDVAGQTLRCSRTFSSNSILKTRPGSFVGRTQGLRGIANAFSKSCATKQLS